MREQGFNGVAVSTFPVATEFSSIDGSRVYVGRARTQMLHGATLIFLSLLGLTQVHVFSRWYHGGPMPNPGAFWILSCLLLFPLGLVRISNAIRGLPRLTIGPQGFSLQLAFKTKWANWDSVDCFVVKAVVAGRSRRQVKTATARITGSNASQKRSKLISIPDQFDSPIEEIAAGINATRVSSLGISHVHDSAITLEEPTPVGLPGFSIPWVTLALLAVLIGVFVLENSFPVTPAVKQAPSLQTLIAMGAVDHAAILSRGEWYRLFTAPLLHANFAHLAGNGVALVLGGWLLERLVGRLWFFVFFAVGALGGSLASLAIQPANLISVGASGALMGMFAGMFVSSFRVSSATSSRARLQINSLRILIPSLLPFSSSATGVHIDYAAHFGGALAGAALALILLRSWPKTAFIPQWRREAAMVAMVSLVLFLGSAGIVIDNYPRYSAALAAPANSPATTEAAPDGRAAYLRGNNTTGKKVYHSLLKCGSLFPTGKGAVPGINCSN
jgi:membrane associated rhomboid family serine protease